MKRNCDDVVRWDVALLDSYIGVPSESDHLWSQLPTQTAAGQINDMAFINKAVDKATNLVKDTLQCI